VTSAGDQATISDAMRIDRGYLFWGIFFVLLGLIPLADREGWIDVGGLGDIGRLWPLIIIGIGIAILVSRTRLALVTTTVAAIVLGTIAGTALASVGGASVFACISTDERALDRTTTNGTLASSPLVRVRMDCGDLAVSTATGDAWTLDAGSAGDPPRVDATTRDLEIRPADGVPQRQDWRLVVPAVLDTLDVDTNASSTTLQLGAATVTHLIGSVNAGDVHVVAPTGSMTSLEFQLNAGDVHVQAPSLDIADLEIQANAASIELALGGSVSGSIRGTAMSAKVCVPSDASLEIVTTNDVGFSQNLRSAGLTQNGDTWTRTGTGPRVSLRIGGTASSFSLDQTGACS
jgi:hypothetical protein